MKRRARVTILSIVLTAQFLSACGSGQPGSGASEQRTFTDAVNSRLEDDGTVGLDLALDLFGATFGSLTGDDSALPRSEDHSGTQAVRAVLANWSELTEDQRQAAERWLTSDGTTPSGPGRSLRAGPPGSRYQSDVDRAIASLEDRLGRMLRIPVVPADTLGMARDSQGRQLTAFARPTDASGALMEQGNAERCDITIVVPRAQRLAPGVLRGVIAHEVFHCFQFQSTLLERHFALAEWIAEGQAAWVEGEQGAPTPSEQGWSEYWETWIQDPSAGLFSRSYDAVGFYAVLAGAFGIDYVWDRIPFMWSGNGNRLAFRDAAQAEGDIVGTRLGSARARIPSLNRDWEQPGRGVPGGRITQVLPLTNGTQRRLAANNPLGVFGSFAAELSLDGDVLIVKTRAPLTAIAFAGGETQRFENGLNDLFCLRPDGCACPDGGLLGGTGGRIGSRGIAGLTTANSGATLASYPIELSVETLAVACRRQPVTEDGDVICVEGTWKVVAAKYSDEIVTALGELSVEGGIGGRTLRLRAGTYTMADDGSDPAVVRTTASGGEPTQSTARIVGEVTGTFAADAGTRTLTFTPMSVTGTIEVTVAIEGADSFVQTIPLSSAGSLIALTGAGRYQCRGGNELTITFEDVSYDFERIHG